MNTATDFTLAIAFATVSTPIHTASPTFSSTPQADIQYTSLTIVGSGGLPGMTTHPEVEVTPG